MKPIMFILILLMFTGCAKEEPLDTKEALSVYITSDYMKYSRDRLDKYFSEDIANDIQAKYLPYVNTKNEFIPWTAREDRSFSIGDITTDGNMVTTYVTFEDEPYVYSYTMTVEDNKIISIERSWVG